MTNAEWKELVAKEFGVRVSAMYSVYRRKKGNDVIHGIYEVIKK